MPRTVAENVDGHTHGHAIVAGCGACLRPSRWIVKNDSFRRHLSLNHASLDAHGDGHTRYAPYDEVAITSGNHLKAFAARVLSSVPPNQARQSDRFNFPVSRLVLTMPAGGSGLPRRYLATFPAFTLSPTNT